MIRPMLAAKIKEDIEDLPYPLYASPKIDGIRALTINGKLYSRTLKPIPNKYTQQYFAGLPEGLDGELVVGDPCDPNLMQQCMSGLMSFEGTPAVSFHLFDTFSNPSYPYWRRLEIIQAWQKSCGIPNLKIVEQTLIHTPETLLEYEAHQLRLGFEGVILRTPTSRYKFGRSTFREAYLLKLKRYTDGEAVVVGFEELEHNLNEQERDELGYAKRSHQQAGKVPGGVLGALLCQDLETGQDVRLGTGFTAAERLHIWENQSSYLGLCVTYKHFAVTGVKDKRRQPVFKCFRDLRDVILSPDPSAQEEEGK
jgi:DNA ligase-1